MLASPIHRPNQKHYSTRPLLNVCSLRRSSGMADDSVVSKLDVSTGTTKLDVSAYSAGQHLKSCLTVKTHRDSVASLYSFKDSSTTGNNRVRFDTVEFRMYPIVLGDNPSTSSGPPIGLGWRYATEDTLEEDIDIYESYRDGDDTQESIRRLKTELRIPPSVREHMLIEAGYSRHEIRLAAKRLQKDKERRIESFRLQKIEPLLTSVESAKSALKRITSRGRRDSLDLLYSG
ncbi:hypothetical protein ACHAXR_011349 [Thalassiosira sp. AJA248-18]